MKTLIIIFLLLNTCYTNLPVLHAKQFFTTREPFFALQKCFFRHAIEHQLAEYKEKSIASNLHANNINIQANNTATIQGSNLTADNEINIAAKDTNIQASRDVATSKTSTKHQNITLGYEVYGGVTTSTSADTAQSTNTQLQHTNSLLQANTININTQEDTTIQGANLHANQQLNINTNNLEVSSVQNTASSKSNSKSFNLSTSGFTPTGAGGSLSKSSSSSAQTLLTSVTGNKVNINTTENTSIKGATIASIDNQGEDNGNLNLNTNTLNISSLNNTSNSKSISVGANLGGSFENNTLNNVSLDYTNNQTNKKTKTLATLGSGNIQITDQTSSDTTMLNRDIANNEVDIYDIQSHKGLKGELDTRLLTEDGRNQIAEDFLKTKMITDTIKQIATNETVNATDFFSNIKKENTTYDAIKEKIAQDPTLAKALNNPKLTDQQREEMMDGVVNAVMVKLGYNAYENKLVSTDEKGRDAKDVKGFYSLETGDSYINQQNISNGNEGLIQVAGTEAQRAIDAQSGSKFDQSQEYRDARSLFSQNVGANVANYTNFALDYTGQGSLSTTTNSLTNTNQVTSTPSIFNSQTANNNIEFAGLDKSFGDNRQLAKEEKALNYTKDAQSLKQALADASPNLSKQDIDNIFETTQKSMVNAFDSQMMNLQLNTTYKNQNEDIQFVSDEAKLYFTEASKNQTYTDRNTLTNRPMMDTNNYNDSTYNPSSDSQIVKNTAASLVRTGLGLVANPVVSIPAWTADTAININNNDFSDTLNSVQNLSPNLVGNPLANQNLQKIGAGVSIFNTIQSVDNYGKQIDTLEQKRDETNTQELQSIYNSNPIEIKKSETPQINFIKVNP